MTAIGYYTECKVTILEAEVEGRAKSFWSNTYKTLKYDRDLYEWLKFFIINRPKLIKMSACKWRNMFKDVMKEGYHRTKCLFIDQVYHEGYKWLQEALYANFSIMHKLLWTFRCYEFGVDD
jgi:hypothetical protein